MIDARIQPLQRAAMRPPAQLLAGWGVTADAISVVGFLIGLMAVAALAFGLWPLALLFIAINRLMDGLDSWERVVSTPVTVNQLENTVHGSLHHYDLADLIGLYGRPVRIQNPRDAAGQPLESP